MVSGSYDEVFNTPRELISSQKRITYSISVENETGGKPIIDIEELEEMIGDELAATGLYSAVTPASSYTNRESEHYHFTFKLHGTNQASRLGITLLSIGTYYLIPFWYTEKVDVSLNLCKNGKNYVMSTNQYARTIIWGPMILGAPFATRGKATEGIVERAVGYFSHEIVKRNLHH
ncbi:MAG: hypothetical protein IJB64_09595 [Akkermansia sp.]|nr:hypothetical protein [Akkermansia sp.]